MPSRSSCTRNRPVASDGNWLRKFRPLADLFFPRSCLLCEQSLIVPFHEAICESCVSEIAPEQQRCSRCSAPLSAKVQSTNDCRLCKSDWHFSKAYCFCTYHGKAARAARLMKSETHEALTLEIGYRLGGWVAETLDCGKYQFLVGIPQHWMRRCWRRYNQAITLAGPISKVTGIPLRNDLLVRTRWTEKQGTKTIEERLRSVRGSFACRSNLQLKDCSILLVDDILTSGATASDAARALRSSGAKEVDVVTFARGASLK